LRALATLPFAVVALRLAVPGLVGTLISLFKNVNNDPSVSGRTKDYAVVFELMGENLLLGRGLFTFVPRYYRILDNQYLVLAIELGIVGLAAAALFLLSTFFIARTTRKRARTARQRHLGLSLSASALGIAISFLTFDALGFPMAAGMTMLLAGLAGATWRLTALEDPTSPYLRHGERVSALR
jgi:polysaccharide biosynthesis protein PslJ